MARRGVCRVVVTVVAVVAVLGLVAGGARAELLQRDVSLAKAKAKASGLGVTTLAAVEDEVLEECVDDFRDEEIVDCILAAPEGGSSCEAEQASVDAVKECYSRNCAHAACREYVAPAALASCEDLGCIVLSTGAVAGLSLGAIFTVAGAGTYMFLKRRRRLRHAALPLARGSAGAPSPHSSSAPKSRSFLSSLPGKSRKTGGPAAARKQKEQDAEGDTSGAASASSLLSVLFGSGQSKPEAPVHADTEAHARRREERGETTTMSSKARVLWAIVMAWGVACAAALPGKDAAHRGRSLQDVLSEAACADDLTDSDIVNCFLDAPQSGPGNSCEQEIAAVETFAKCFSRDCAHELCKKYEPPSGTQGCLASCRVLSTAAVVGLSVGAVVLVAGVAVFLVRERRKRQEEAAQAEQAPAWDNLAAVPAWLGSIFNRRPSGPLGFLFGTADDADDSKQVPPPRKQASYDDDYAESDDSLER
ncbi:unnamed protein product [Durusdinium trenchii]|uniref:Uncharacterized protein n=1 Tax=Durusdinium trenchii TaxID=1381693 RepID=A0ABP0HHJ0_9DINO